ncbi:MAG: AraC family transcriptional regulator, partial [Chloroflexota bacterium]
MSGYFEGRASHSPYISTVWRGGIVEDYMPVCPADTHWNLLFMRRQGQTIVVAEGPPTTAFVKNEDRDSEFLVIQFEHGVYIPQLPPSQLVNSPATLPTSASKRGFSLNSEIHQIPDFDDVEIFVDRLVRTGNVIVDPT